MSFFSFFAFFSAVLLTFPGPARTYQPCVYPCYSPPIGGGSTPTTNTVTPSLPQTGGTVYSPPTGYNNYPYNYNQPPPYGFGGGGGVGSGFYGAPPPPDPILPYFPFYYRKPPHGTGGYSSSSSSETSASTSAATAATTTALKWTASALCLILFL
ncbi:hypothetical protein QN277_029291 [Acacia crassicarpa]|uniref:Uncharacterized protein n=1 Tax=Acacia crassicarpa TaxID=499986 RepID=A0AAE1J7I5_9FABA|nr:hypothetical protein QN277_029291 [Acacia crassicarpa]